MEKSNKAGKVIYINTNIESINLEIATNYKEEALPTIKQLCDKVALHRPTGEQVTVSIELDEWAYDKKEFMQASAARDGLEKYKIEVGVGLIAQLSTIARGIAADKSALRGRTKAKIIHADLRKNGREQAIANFAFHYMLTFILWHEIAHVVLGHLDWLDCNNSLGVMEEFGYQPMPHNLFTQYQTLEADADRQASVWTSATIDYITKSNPFLRYPSLADLFYDIGYIYGTLFSFLDAVDADVPHDERKHPKADIRLGVTLAFVEDYLNKHHPTSSKILQPHVISGGVDAITRILHPKKHSFNPLPIFFFMHENGKRLDDMNVRKFQLKMSHTSSGSFKIVGID